MCLIASQIGQMELVFKAVEQGLTEAEKDCALALLAQIVSQCQIACEHCVRADLDQIAAAGAAGVTSCAPAR